MMNFEGTTKIHESVLQAKGALILPVIIRSSLFDIRYSFLSSPNSRARTESGSIRRRNDCDNLKATQTRG